MEAEVIPLLQSDCRLNAVTLLDELQRRHPGHYDSGVLRTLQRRLRQWRAVHGAEREIYFAQEHPSGRLGLSDFTVCDHLGVQINGAAFAHRLYQFALAHSGWRHAQVSVGGESFIALSAGLQAALWRLGGVPEEHRTDSLSAAFNNLAEKETLTHAMRSCAVTTACAPAAAIRASRTRTAPSNRATIRSRARWTRRCACAAVGAFEDRASYETFVDTIVERMNARAAKRLAAERPLLKSLPARRTAEYEELPARVSKYAIFTVKGVQYSAPSQLIGHRLMVRQYAQHIECWLSGQCVLERPRAAPVAGQRPCARLTIATWSPHSSANPAHSHAGCCATRHSRGPCTARPGSGWPQQSPNAKRAKPWSACGACRPMATRRNWPRSWSS